MAKVSKQEASYGGGNPMRNCGICTMYRTPDSCSAVEGEVSPYGYCKLFKVRKNPFKRRGGIMGGMMNAK
jgi:hypothetical protein